MKNNFINQEKKLRSTEVTSYILRHCFIMHVTFDKENYNNEYEFNNNKCKQQYSINSLQFFILF